ncbi:MULTISPECIES: type I-E CRISPR-associated protein Cas6/Cse3/CasE [Corynebacterium]|uniref:Type I-E CRISPR-associated protein Cas6/Cse3/CasE n=2 Tax=Corynebacterium TaxID=1716 RepID=A0AB36RIJ5_9CORY|nr:MULTISPECIES: type I-E CRISPR-associated protein Cas6/Cse3/CasE [Corynebacterium]PAT09633.1 type I-E CRISPR-associated protein Cas6/Cse3/CasE [Corynebacterium hadale]RMD18342.1 type I-E CRISPR-associated protein Cas6/Cse3/CasE [Corynebacterium gottingense]WJZ14187.1 CRISPR-associated endoribonuclease Cse3 [Corynebacterium gottingense]
MTTLSRIVINPVRRGGAKLLTNTHAMHAAVRSSFPNDIDLDAGRVLWRVDPREHEHVLYIVGPEKPTGAHIVEQAGWDTRPAQSTDYERFLAQLTRGQRWRFELVANPTFSEANGAGRGKVKAHVSVRHQVGWLYKRAAEAGFALAPRAEDEVSDEERARWSPLENVGVTERWTDTFFKNPDRRGRPVRIAKARFAGTLEVTDPEKLRKTLTHGIGRARGYGCGLMTLAQVR